MKKLLILLFSILISFNSYGEVELDFSLDSFCTESPKAQIRRNLFYLPNTQKPYSGENICVYLSNGQYYSQGDIKEGLRDGVWNFWYENGQIKSEGYYENGQIRSEKHYKDGELDGVHTEWYENGQKESEANYKNNKLNGKFNVWYENGQKKLVGNTRDDQYDGKQTIWHANGQMEGVANFKNGKQDGENTEWYENGQKKLEEIWKDGKLEVKLVFENDKLVGKTKYSYYPNGQIWSEKNYKNDELVGETYYEYYENGQIERKRNFKDNRLVSQTTYSYYENGEKERVKNFREQILKSGMGILTLDGKSTWWHKNGQKMFEGIFNYGILDVKWTRWYEDGRKSVEGNVKDDKIFRKTTWWHKNGQKKYEIIAKKYNKHGGLRTFFWHYGSSDNRYEDSDIEMQFSLQKYEGMWTAWDENGDLRFVRNYKDGECVSEDC